MLARFICWLGRPARIERKLDALTAKVEQLLQKGISIMAGLDDIRAATAVLRASVEALATRLEDNPTPEERAAIVADLRALGTQIDGFDPDIPTGPITPGVIV